jgi:hypothetical protein
MTKLLDHGADPNARGAHGLTPLAVASRSGRVEAIELLLARGADPHRGSGVNGWTPLLHALHKGQLAAAERLIATCTAPSAELDDALFMAAGYAQTEAVAALLARGADPRKDFGDGANALSNAVAGAFDIDFSYRGCATHTATVRALLSTPELKLEGKAGASARKLSQPPRELVWYLPSLAVETHPATSRVTFQISENARTTTPIRTALSFRLLAQ